jgi:hypothetical protein
MAVPQSGANDRRARGGFGHEGGIDAAGNQQLDRLDRRSGSLQHQIGIGVQTIRGEQPAEDQVRRIVPEGHDDLFALQRRNACQGRIGGDDIQQPARHDIDQPHAEAAIVQVGGCLRRHHHHIHRLGCQAGPQFVGIAPGSERCLVREPVERSRSDGPRYRDGGPGRWTEELEFSQLRR